MARVLKRPQFLLDLAEELNWLVDRAGAEVATKWYRSLGETIDQLRRHPFLGRERTDLSPSGIRSWRVKDYPRWLIFYSVARNGDLVLYRVRQGMINLVVLKIKS